MIDFKKIILGCFKENKTSIVEQVKGETEEIGTLFCKSYFERQARKYKQIEFIEPFNFYLKCIEASIDFSTSFDNALLSFQYLNKMQPIFETALYELLQEFGQTDSPKKLIKTLDEKKQSYLFSALTENSLFFSTETDFASFCFVFGNSKQQDDFKPLQWMQNKQLLRELIAELKHPDIFITTNKYTLPNYFIDEKGNTILYLPTDKKINNKLSNSIAKIAIKLRQTK